MTGVIAGPLALQVLGDYGADIVRIEPIQGDVMRAVGPVRNAHMGPMHLQLNRNKRCIAIDPKSAGGAEVIRQLLAGAAVFAHNMRPTALARLDLDYATCRETNPSLVHVTISGYGEGGQYSGRPAYDDIMQAGSGLASLFAHANGQRSRYAPLNLADRVTGLTAAHAILAALFHRQRTGEGQAVEIPMFETLAGFLLGDHLAGQGFRPSLGKSGYARVTSPNRRPFETLDGEICVLPYTDKHWQSMFAVAGAADTLGRDPRFIRQRDRAQHYDAIYEALAQILSTRTTQAWLDELSAADIPCSPVRSLDDLGTDPHLADVNFFQDEQHPSEGALRLPRSPVRMSRTPTATRVHAGRIGEHTREVLQEVGYTPAQIEELLRSGAALSAGHREAPPSAPATKQPRSTPSRRSIP